MNLITPISTLPSGIIALWKGPIATIPAGWALCDGTNGTPDLRDKFIVGAKQDSSGAAKTNVSGSLTQSGGAAMASFHFSGTTLGSTDEVGVPGDPPDNLVTNSGHNHDFSGNTDSASILPPYFALAYIMKL